MISQFVSPYEQRLLCHLDFDFPEGTHAVGRLDEHSEGLLILTTDKTMTRRLLHPTRQHSRHYLVQVEHRILPQTVEQMRSGMDIMVKKRGIYRTQPCNINLVEKPATLAPHENDHKTFISYSWLSFEMTEGKNRQIRKMCKAVRHNCRRLIRTQIEDLELGSLQPGQVKEMEQQELFSLLKLN